MPSASSSIGSALVPLVVTVVLSFLARSVSRRATATPDGLLLHYGAMFRVIACIAAAITLALGITYFFVDPDDKLPVLVMVVLFGGLALPIALEAFGVAIELKRDSIAARSPWRGSRVIPLADLQSVTFSKANQWYVINSKSHGVVRLHTFLSGVPEFLGALEARTGLKPI